jgi:hypothetical protein
MISFNPAVHDARAQALPVADSRKSASLERGDA